MAQFEDQNYLYHSNNADIWYAPTDLGLPPSNNHHHRSKTPASPFPLIGTPSGPLSTPPQSRNPSQPPEQMNCDELSGSQSASPTSVRTPDNEAFDSDMRDGSESVRNFYYGDAGPQVNQVTQEEPMDVSMANYEYSNDQVMQQFMAQFTMPQQFNTQFTSPAQPLQNHLTGLNYNEPTFAANYSRQPHQQDPWSGQGPPRNPMEPQSDMCLWDPQSDQQNYGPWIDRINPTITDWQHNSTDPNYLVSPNTPARPPLETQFSFGDSISPVEMKVTISPATNSGFNNFQYGSNLYAEPYLRDPQTYASPGVNSTDAQPALSPYQGAVSPQISAPSPGSDAIFSSYQASDSGMLIDTHPIESVESKPPPMSPVHLEEPSLSSSLKTTPERTLHGPEVAPSQHEKEKSSKASRGAGGRALGTHLKPRVAKEAHDMRKIVACWHCVLQRDKCGPGDECERCIKRAQRPNADCGLGCSRVKLIELSASFIPSMIRSMHEDAQLRAFVSQHIQQWTNIETTIYLSCGENMPRIPVKVYEFAPKTHELVQQYQYQVNPETHKCERVLKRSPPLGMVHINQNEEKKYDRYINEIVDQHMDAFGDLCRAEDDNDFQHNLIKMMVRMQPKSEDEKKLLHEVFRLQVCTFIMGHALTIAEETKHQSLSRLHSYTRPSDYVSDFTSPRMTNRQLKHFFHRLHNQILSNVLNKLQQIFKSSKGCDKWVSAFIAVVGLAMASEDQQRTIHLVMETKAASGECGMQDGQCRADFANREIDDRFMFISQIFRWKYNRRCNPLRDNEVEWEKEVGFGDKNAASFVRSVAGLVKENIDFLSDRQRVSISSSNQMQYTSRLVAQFLLSFWLPS